MPNQPPASSIGFSAFSPTGSRARSRRGSVWLPQYLSAPLPPAPLAPTNPVRQSTLRPIWRPGFTGANPSLCFGTTKVVQRTPLGRLISRFAGDVMLAAGPPQTTNGPPPGSIFEPEASPRRLNRGRVWQPTLPPRPPITEALPWKILAGGQPRRRGHVFIPALGAPPTGAATQEASPWKIAAGGQPRRRGHAGQAQALPPEAPPPPSVLNWRILGCTVPRRRGHVVQTGLPPQAPITALQWHVAYLRQRNSPGHITLPRVTSPPPAALTVLAPAFVVVRSPRRPHPGSTWSPRFGYQSPPVFKTPLHGLFAARYESRIRSHGGRVIWPTSHEAVVLAPVTAGYYIYSNSGAGLPINYATPIGTNLGWYNTTWTSSPLSYPGDWWFAVRAFDQYGTEQNLDCAVEVILDASGNDITDRPLAPYGLRALSARNASIRVEWYYPPTSGAKTPTGFHVYVSPEGGTAPVSIVSAAPSRWNSGAARWSALAPFAPTTPVARLSRSTPAARQVRWSGAAGIGIVYGTPAATVSYGAAIANTYGVTIGGYRSPGAYYVAVRAYNATAEEPNTAVVTVATSNVGPSAVTNLTITATSTA
jgi:hypothetical protein